MKKLIFIVLLTASPSWGAIALVQKVISDSCSNTISANAAGNLLVVACEGQTTYPTAVADNASGGSNTYNEIVPSRAGLFGNVGLTSVWYSQTAHSGATTVTCTSASDCYGSAVYEYSGALASGNPVDTSSGSVSTGCSAASCSGPSITTTNSGDVIFAYSIPGVSITAVGAPYANFLGGTGNGQGAADYLPGSTVSGHQVVWTDSSGGDSVGTTTAAFLPAEESPPPPSSPTGILTTSGSAGLTTTNGSNGLISTRQ